jgi:hypothetical protein
VNIKMHRKSSIGNCFVQWELTDKQIDEADSYFLKLCEQPNNENFDSITTVLV